MIGLELGISVASVTLRGEPTGRRGGLPRRAGDRKKGPPPGGDPQRRGGSTVYGTLIAGRRSVAAGTSRSGLPMGQAWQTDRRRRIVKWTMSSPTGRTKTVKFRREMEALFKRSGGYDCMSINVGFIGLGIMGRLWP